MYYIVRHGQTETNKKKALQGRSNAPLNEAGREQALRLAAYFKAQGITFDAVYSSPLIRAVETAQLIAGEQAEVQVDERLLEMDYGPYEGISLEKEPPKELLYFFADFVNHPAPEGMEQLSSVVGRTGEFIETLAGQPEKNILISAHAISMKGVLEYLTPESKGAYWSKYLANCGVYQFDYEEGSFTIPEEIMYNDDQATPGV